MNAPGKSITAFVDLKAQYAALRETIDARMRTVLEHGQFILGPEVKELEERLAQYTGVRHCVTCASGTEALLIALMALDIKPGDEVITTPFTFVATAEMIVLLGAIPVFVDVEADTCNIDARQIEAAITSRTRALMPVSLYGQPADMDEIDALARDHGLAVIEDAAQSFGATYKGRKSCHLSAIGCTSFFPSKPLACYGDGGALFTDDETLAQAMREIRTHGQERHYYHTRVGVGGRMDTLQCAVVLAKLERFEWEIERRKALGQRYTQKISNLVPQLRTLALRPERTSVFAQYTVLCDDRDDLQQRLRERGIPTAVHYPTPLHHQPAYAAFAPGRALPVAEALARQVISLPIYPDMTDEMQDAIVDAVRGATAQAAPRTNTIG